MSGTQSCRCVHDLCACMHACAQACGWGNRGTQTCSCVRGHACTCMRSYTGFWVGGRGIGLDVAELGFVQAYAKRTRLSGLCA